MELKAIRERQSKDNDKQHFINCGNPAFSKESRTGCTYTMAFIDRACTDSGTVKELVIMHHWPALYFVDTKSMRNHRAARLAAEQTDPNDPHGYQVVICRLAGGSKYEVVRKADVPRYHARKCGTILRINLEGMDLEYKKGDILGLCAPKPTAKQLSLAGNSYNCTKLNVKSVYIKGNNDYRYCSSQRPYIQEHDG